MDGVHGAIAGCFFVLTGKAIGNVTTFAPSLYSVGVWGGRALGTLLGCLGLEARTLDPLFRRGGRQRRWRFDMLAVIMGSSTPGTPMPPRQPLNSKPPDLERPVEDTLSDLTLSDVMCLEFPTMD